MNNLVRLIKGELKRYLSYKILPISIATSFIWVVIFLFLTKDDAKAMAPLLMYVDVTVMSIILISASVFLEKQEGSIKSMMVMPVSLSQILIAKLISALILSFISVLILSIAIFFIHQIDYNYLIMILVIICAGLAHVIIGYFLSLFSKDFTTSLFHLMIYLFIFTIPTILLTFNIISSVYEWILFISPSHAASYLINATVLGDFDLIKTLFSFIYLLVFSFVVVNYLVFPKFKDNAVRG